MVQLGFFDAKERLKVLSSMGDPLERLSKVIDFELFRCDLEQGLDLTQGGAKGGRPPYDAVLMFKVLLLQTLYNLSDDQVEYQIKDRLSFMRFLRLHIAEKVPDAKTVWLYRERLTKAGVMDKVFSSFDVMLKDQGYLAMGGQIVDASIISAPRQRMTKPEKEDIKEGKIPQNWKTKPAKLAQKDRDARWVVKYSAVKDECQGVNLAIPLYGYKNHISTDKRFGFIRKYHVTDASKYDGKLFSKIIDLNNTARVVWGDTAYRSKENLEYLSQRGLTSRLHRKKSKGKPMPKNISRGNNTKSKIRSKVEHVFAVQKGPMNLFIRTIGIARATTKLSLANLVYNMKRLIFWERQLELATA